MPALTLTESLLEIVQEWWPPFAAGALVVLGLMGSRRLLDRSESKTSRQGGDGRAARGGGLRA